MYRLRSTFGQIEVDTPAEFAEVLRLLERHRAVRGGCVACRDGIDLKDEKRLALEATAARERRLRSRPNDGVRWTSSAVRGFIESLSGIAFEVLTALAKSDGAMTIEELGRAIGTDPRGIGPTLGAIARRAETGEFPAPVRVLRSPENATAAILDPDFQQVFRKTLDGDSREMRRHPTR